MADVTKMRAMHPDFDEQEAALKADDAAFQAAVDKLAEQGLAPDVVARMRSLSGYGLLTVTNAVWLLLMVMATVDLLIRLLLKTM